MATKRSTRKKKAEPTAQEAVESILSDPRVVYFPVFHFSPVCAYHVQRLIREVKPVAVLVEGPDDADDLLPWVVHEDTWAPFTILSTYTDKKNNFGLNGVLSPNEDTPARFRSWWPATPYSPEYVALKAGAEVGAELGFIDVPLLARIPYRHVPSQQASTKVDNWAMAQWHYSEVLRKAQRRRSFDEFISANFEVGGAHLDTEQFMRVLLTYCYCGRKMAGDEGREAEYHAMREAHMRWHINARLKKHPEGKVVVVTGGSHSAMLQATKAKKAKVRKDRNMETILAAHSFKALANLCDLNRLPAYGQAVWEQLQADADEPFNMAAMQLLLQVMRHAREDGQGISTADSVGAYQVARNLTVLRNNPEITLQDLTDAVQMAYVKGDIKLRGGEMEAAAQQVLIGRRLGRVTSEAGQAPLIRDFYDRCKTHRLEVTGDRKEVRCDLHKQVKHRHKSAFLHQCSFLAVPMFSRLDSGGGKRWNAPAAVSKSPDYYKGPDLVNGENMHLITETWGVQWNEQVDDKLLELSSYGATVAAASAAQLRTELGDAKGNAQDTTTLLLRCAQMMLMDTFEEVLEAVEDAIVVDSSFVNLINALHNFVVLYSYRDAVATQGMDRLLNTIITLFNKAVIVLPGIANANADEVPELLGHLQTLVRVTLTFEGVMLDRQHLIEKIQEMVNQDGGAAAIRGAGYGVLFSFGATREKVVARELNGYLMGSHERILQAGAFLDGLFMSSKSIFMGSPRLMRAINRVLGELDWDTFKIILPDLRRAFTQFIPSEIDDISVRVSEEIGIDEAPTGDEPVPMGLAAVGARADARVCQLLEGWW